MNYYLHDLNPVIFPIWKSLAVRWYSLSYLFSFVAFFLFLKYYVKKNILIAENKNIESFVTFVAIFGVLIGGRLGYMIFYAREDLFQNPLSFFMILNGGMSSHGGVIGVTLVIYIYSWKNKLSPVSIGDLVCSIVPIGFFFGRIANFINGELYGRVADGFKYAVQFPAELYAEKNNYLPMVIKKAEQLGLNFGNTNENSEHISKLIKKSPPFSQYLTEILSPRHPSQLYQAVCEGLILFTILILIKLNFKKLYDGIIIGLFFIFYAVFRILIENYREPDSTLIMGITKGQFYSYLMIPIGFVFIIYALIKKNNSIARL